MSIAPTLRADFATIEVVPLEENRREIRVSTGDLRRTRLTVVAGSRKRIFRLDIFLDHSLIRSAYRHHFGFKNPAGPCHRLPSARRADGGNANSAPHRDRRLCDNQCTGISVSNGKTRRSRADFGFSCDPLPVSATVRPGDSQAPSDSSTSSPLSVEEAFGSLSETMNYSLHSREVESLYLRC